MKKKEQPLFRLWKYARGFRGKIIGASIISILNKIFDLAPPALIGAAVDVVVQQENSLIARLGFPDPRIQLLVLAALTLVIWVFESLFEYYYAVKWRNIAQSLQHQLRVNAYGHVQALELAYYEDKTTGDYVGFKQRY